MRLPYHDDGSLDVEAWLVMYEDDDIVLWYTDMGELMNVIDHLLEREGG